MPLLAYFTVTGPLLLAALLALSASLEPEKAPTTAELLGIPSAKAEAGSAAAAAQNTELSDFQKLKLRPLNH